FMLAVTNLLGLLMPSTLLMTGLLFQYLRPIHRRREATLAEVTGSGSAVSSVAGSGGVGPPRVTDEMRPARCIARASLRLYFVLGSEVRPSRARVAFWRWEKA